MLQRRLYDVRSTGNGTLFPPPEDCSTVCFGKETSLYSWIAINVVQNNQSAIRVQNKNIQLNSNFLTIIFYTICNCFNITNPKI